MILDSIYNHELYEDLHEGFTKAFEFLLHPDLIKLPAGEYQIDGRNVYAIVAHDKGRCAEDAQLEGHRKYIDIQYVISGDESMGWKSRHECTSATEYNEEKDLEFFNEDSSAIVKVHPKTFTIFFPNDAHMPLIGTGAIHKVIIKVAMQNLLIAAKLRYSTFLVLLFDIQPRTDARLRS